MQNDPYIQLLYKQLSGDIESREQEQLEEWLNESAEHRLVAAAIEKAWGMSENYQMPDVPDLDHDADFATLEKRIAAAEIGAPVRELQPRSLPWLRIAAAVALLLAAGFLLRQWIGANEEWQIAATEVDERQKLELTDGSTVWLNENTKIQYPKNFKGNLRELKLEGEAFFEIEKNPNKAFVVYTASGSVRVLGTSFNVRDRHDEALMNVQVKTGKVQVENMDKSTKTILIAGEQAQIDKAQNTLMKIDAPIENAFYWQTGILIYDNQPLSKVLKDLEEAYKVKIRLSDEGMAVCLFSSILKEKRIEQILNIIAKVFEMEVIKIDDKTYELNGGRC